jgi:hypothetical protein
MNDAFGVWESGPRWLEMKPFFTGYGMMKNNIQASMRESLCAFGWLAASTTFGWFGIPHILLLFETQHLRST